MSKYKFILWKFENKPWNESDVGSSEVSSSYSIDEMMNLKDVLESEETRNLYYDVRVERCQN